MNATVKVEGLGKRFRVGTQATRPATFRDAVSAGLGWSVTPLFSTPLIAGVVAAPAVFAAVGSLVPALLYSTDRTTNSGTER